MSDLNVGFQLDIDSSAARKASADIDALKSKLASAEAAGKSVGSGVSAAFDKVSQSIAASNKSLGAAVARMQASGAERVMGLDALRKSNASASAVLGKDASGRTAANLFNRSAYDRFREALRPKASADLGSDIRYTTKGNATQQIMSKMLGGAESLFGKGSANSIMEALGGLTKMDAALGKVGTSLSGVAGAGMTAISIGAAAAVVGVLALAAAIGAVVAVLGTLAYKGAEAFATFTVKTGVFREDALNAFNAILKDKAIAKDMYNRAIKVAADTPFETTQVIDTFKMLMGGGFKAAEVEKIVRSFSDLAVIKPEGLKDATEAMIKLRGTGKLTEEVLERFQTAGISKAAIAKANNIKVADVSKLTGAKAEDAILKAIADMAGGGGETKSKALSGLWSTLTSRPFELFNEAFDKTEKSGEGVTRLFSIIKDAVGKLADMMDAKSPSGAKFVDVINAIGSAMAFLAKGALEFGKGMFEGLAKGWDAAGGEKGSQALTNLQAAAEMGKAFKTIGEAIGYLIGAGAAIGVVFASIATGVEKVAQYGDTIKAVLVGIGVAAAGLLIVGVVIAGLAALLVAPFVFGAFLIVGAIALIGVAILAIPIAIGVAVGAVLLLISYADKAAASFGNIGASLMGSFGLGGDVAANPFSGTSLPGGFTLSSPVEAPSAKFGTVPSSPGGKGGDQNITNTITVSGVGLDLAQLAQLIRSQVAQALVEAAPGAA
jgi:hypothetical protein